MATLLPTTTGYFDLVNKINAAGGIGGSSPANALTNPQVLAVPFKRKAVMHRAMTCFGNTSTGNANASGTSNLLGFYVKFEVPDVDFDAVDFVFFNPTTNTYSPIKFLAACTETMADDTVTNRFLPVVNGVSKNTDGPDVNGYGWYRGSFSAGAGTTYSKSATGTPTIGNSNVDGYVVSDPVPLVRVPRADGGSGSIIMLRATTPNDGNTYNLMYVGTNGGAANVSYNTSFPKRKIYGVRDNTDRVTTLSTPSLSSSIGADFINVVPRLYKNGALVSTSGTTLFTGDSIGRYSVSVDGAGWDAWTTKAADDADPSGGIISLHNPGTASEVWLAELQAFLASAPDGSIRRVVMPASTPNVNLSSGAGALTTCVSLEIMMKMCLDKGIKVFLWTPYAQNGNDTNSNTLQVGIQWAIKQQAAGRATLIRIDQLFPTGTAHLIGGTDVHPTAVAAQAMRVLTAQVLAANP